MTTLKRRRLGLTHWDEQKSAGGFTLFAPQTGNGRVVLLRDDGEVEHEWQMPVRPGRDAVILPNGNLGYNGSHKTSVNLYAPWDVWHGGHFMEATPEGDIVWEHEDIYHHHDAEWLDDGLLYCAAEVAPNGRQSDVVKKVNRAGETVWEWNVWEASSPVSVLLCRHGPAAPFCSLDRPGCVHGIQLATGSFIGVWDATALA